MPTWFLAGLTLNLQGCGKDAPPGIADPEEPAIAPPAPSLRRLTFSQYQNAVVDLLGEGLVLPSSLEQDTEVDGFLSIGASVTSLTPTGAERYETAAYQIAEQIAEDTERLEALMGCTPEGPTDSECAESFAEGFGRRAWRRPLSAEEVGRIGGVITSIGEAAGDFTVGAEFGIAAFLQSPHFLYRTEHGEGGTELGDFELASRISFLVWNSIPDEELLDAAEAGELGSGTGMDAQFERMLEDGKASRGIRNLFTEMYGLNGLDSLSKDPLVFTHASPELGPAAKEEMLLGIEALALGGDDFRDLLTTRHSYVDRRLGALYNIAAPTPDGFGEVWLEKGDGRRGLLGQAGYLLLAAHPTGTSATLRGLFIRQKLLCQSIPAPPANVDTSIPESDAESPTLRERIASHLEDPTCATCHELTDLPGLGLENFDGVGRWRDTENGASIDASGSIDGVSFANAWELGEVLRRHESLGPCFAENLLKYAFGHTLEDGEAEYHDWLSESFAYNGYSFRAMLRALVLSEGFRQIGEAQ
jgi:hypothetical protein